MLRSFGKLYTWWLHRSALMAAKRSPGPKVSAAPAAAEIPPLHQAAARDDADTVRRLLDGGTSVDERDGQGNTPLHHAVKAGAVNAVRVLRLAGAKLEVLNAKDASPYSALPMSGPKCPELAKALYPEFHSLTHDGGDGVTPEVVAVRCSLEMARSIVALERNRELAARVMSRVLFWKVGIPTAEFQAEELAAAVRAGIDPQWKAEETGQTMLHAAVEGSVPSLVSAVLEAGASPDDTDLKGKTPFLEAMTFQEQGANSWDFGPLRKNALAIVRLLIDGGATTTARDAAGHSAPHLLMSENASGVFSEVTEEHLRELLMLLISKNPDLVNVRDGDGRTPLHYAFEFGKAWAVTMLVVAGADLRALEKHGRVPRQVLDAKLKSTGPGKKKVPTEWEKCEVAYREAVEAINTSRELRSTGSPPVSPSVQDVFAAIEREKRANAANKRP